MKIGDKVRALGFLDKDEEGETIYVLPEWLIKGTHRITHLKKNGFGTLIKTDKQQMWMNAVLFD